VPAFAQLLLTDSESIQHTFDPKRIDGDVAYWVERTLTDVPIGFETLSMKLRQPPSNTGGGPAYYKFVADLQLPVVVTETVNGVDNPIVARSARAKVELLLPADSSSEERSNLRSLIKEALGSAMCADLVDDLSNVY
jgi:hypothetical protein